MGLAGRTFFYRDRRTPPQPRPDLPHHDVVLDGNDGARLAARYFALGDRRVRGVVVLVHPDKRRGQRWFLDHGYVAFLLNAGYEVLTFDLACYGESRGGSVFLHEDVVAAARHAEREAGGLPVHVLGTSLGAFFAALAAPDLPFVDTLVLESPFPNFAAWYGDRPGAGAWRAFRRVFPRATGTIDASRRIADARVRRILVVASDADAVTPLALSRRVAEAAPPERTRTLELAGAAHLRFLGEETYRSALLDALGGRAAQDRGDYGADDAARNAFASARQCYP